MVWGGEAAVTTWKRAGLNATFLVNVLPTSFQSEGPGGTGISLQLYD